MHELHNLKVRQVAGYCLRFLSPKLDDCVTQLQHYEADILLYIGVYRYAWAKTFMKITANLHYIITHFAV